MANISARGLDLIKRFEGLRLVSYRDAVGVWTIGFGHTGPAAKPNNVISRDAADQLLAQDVDRFVRGVQSAVQVVLSQEQFDALVSLAFNIGLGAFQRSSLLAYLNRNDYTSAADEFLKWVYAGGRQLPGLQARRNVERDLFKQTVIVETLLPTTFGDGNAEGEATDAPNQNQPPNHAV